MKNPDFRENVIIITGALFGIGRQLALLLAEYGAWLAVASRPVFEQPINHRPGQLQGLIFCLLSSNLFNL